MSYKFVTGSVTMQGALTANSNITAKNSPLSGSSLNVGSANLSATDLEQIDGISAGTAAASKAMVPNGSA